MRGKCDNKEGDLNWAHPFPKVSGYKSEADIKEGDITEIRVNIKYLKCLSYTLFVPKRLSNLPDFLVPKGLSDLFALLEIWGSMSNIFAPNFYHPEVLWDRNFKGHFEIVVIFYF